MDPDNEPPRVIFNGEEPQHRVRSFQTPAPRMIQLVIKCSGGYITDEKRANYFLIGFVIIAITISLFLVFGGGAASNPKDINILPAEF